MQRKLHFPTEGPVVKAVLVQADDKRFPAINPPDRGWKLGNHLAELVTAFNTKGLGAGMQLHSTIKSGDTPKLLDGVKLTCVLPTTALLAKAKVELKKAPARGPHQVTPINYTGIVLIAEVEGKKLLFTGDADGEDIAAALEDLCDEGPHDFDYIDMPHHGSQRNYPAEFLASVNAKHIAVSTSGENHGHPDKATLQALDAYLTSHAECHLYFNYKLHVTPGTKVADRDVLKSFNVGVRARIHFPKDERKYVEINL